LNKKIKETLTSILTEKNITFLLGAGTSAPFFSSLGNLENVLTHSGISENGRLLVRSIFYEKSIAKNSYLLDYTNDQLLNDNDGKQMLSILFEYKRFIHNIIEYLKVRNSRVSPKRVNIITTNYDLFIETAMDDILVDNPRVHFNDGTNGYLRRILQTDNFNKTLLYSGVFDNYSNEMPTINLIKCHGSINWKEYYSSHDSKKRIQIQTRTENIYDLNNKIDSLYVGIDNFMAELNVDVDEIDDFIFDDEEVFEYDLHSIDDLISIIDIEEPIDIENDINLIGDKFEEELIEISKLLEDIQIVYPTKKKFESTLVNEYYFGLLRLLSYELEKEQSTLVVFGFSFYDEHITEIVQRSLNNPNLIVIIFCYTDESKDLIISNFNFTCNSIPNNVHFITPNDFIEEVIDLESYKEKYSDLNLSNDNITYNEEDVTIYSSEVSIVNIAGNPSYAVLNFDSLNDILESEISNKYFVKEKKTIFYEDGDIVE